jgi:alpha-methylacyl-CoA racemase
VLADAFRARTRDEWAELFAPLDACVAPVLTLDEAPRHPHNEARGSFVDVAGTTLPAPVPRMSATPAAVGDVPGIGADTDTLLAELGYSREDLAELRSAGALADA